LVGLVRSQQADCLARNGDRAGALSLGLRERWSGAASQELLSDTNNMSMNRRSMGM
jgi:hypothetical protein